MINLRYEEVFRVTIVPAHRKIASARLKGLGLAPQMQNSPATGYFMRWCNKKYRNNKTQTYKNVQATLYAQTRLTEIGKHRHFAAQVCRHNRACSCLDFGYEPSSA